MSSVHAPYGTERNAVFVNGVILGLICPCCFTKYRLRTSEKSKVTINAIPLLKVDALFHVSGNPVLVFTAQLCLRYQGLFP